MKIFPLYTCKINFIGVHFRLFLFQRVGRMREGECYSPIRGGEGDRVRPDESDRANAIRPYVREVFLRKLQKISDLISLKIESAN